MTASLLVLTACLMVVGGITLLIAHRLRWIALTAVILALLVIAAEAPRAGAELWGIRVDGVIAATQESLRLETRRAGGSRTSHHAISHQFGVSVCYRLANAPGIGVGAPMDPAVLTAVGEAVSAADRLCAQAPGQAVLRQAEIGLDERAHDAEIVGRPVSVLVWRPLGLFEWAWSIDAPLLPMLPRPRLDSGPEQTLEAEVVAITVDTRGRSPISRRARDYAIPVAYVRLRYVLPNQPAGLEGVDAVDAPSVDRLGVGARVSVVVNEATPRRPSITGASRSHWWRNPASEILIVVVILALVVGTWLLLRRRRARMRSVE